MAYFDTYVPLILVGSVFFLLVMVGFVLTGGLFKRRMETLETAKKKIVDEVISDSGEVRQKFLELLSGELDELSIYLGHAVVDWLEIDADLRNSSRRALASGLMHATIALLTVSTKLLFEGHLVASGNSLRQAMETIAISMLISNKDIPVFEQFQNHVYSTNKSLRDLVKNADKLGISKPEVERLKEQAKQYDRYSHITYGTIASYVSFKDKMSLYVGGSYDEEKEDAYKVEMNIRLTIAGGLKSVFECIRSNLDASES